MLTTGVTRKALLAALLSGISTQALAQSVENIIVSAERRETSLLETPVAVSAVGADELQKRAFNRVNDLAGLSAGITIPNQNYANQTMFVRGVGSTIASGNPMVGFYIDDVYIARPFGIGWYGNLPDIERIEVVRGPQGTLYGQNSAAGAIKLISRKPTDEFKGSLDLTAGTLGNFGARGYESGAIVPGILTGSLAYSHLQTTGPDYNPVQRRHQGGLLNDQARGILRYTPNEDLEIILSVDALRDRSEYRTAAPATAPAGYVADPHFTFSETPSQQPFNGIGTTLRVGYNIDSNLKLNTISAWRAFDTWTPNDTDGLPTYRSGFTRNITQNVFSQEVQLQGTYDDLEFTTGFIWFSEVLNQYRFSWSNNSFSGQNSHNGTDSAGLYGQVKYRLTDDLSATVGIRFNRETKSMDSNAYRSNLLGATTSLDQIAFAPGTILGPIYNVAGLEKTYWATTPRVGLDYKITPETLLYASWSSGQSSGGYNQASPSLTVASIPVDAQKVSAFEVGLKTSLFDNRVQVSTNGFYNDFRAYQATITNPVIGGVVQTGTIQVNAGDAHIYGGELEVRAQTLDNLENFLSATILRSAFDSYLNPTGAATSNYVGQELPYVPKFSFAAGGTYTVPLQDQSEIALFVSYRYESSSFSDITPTRAQIKFPDQQYVDASLSYTLPSKDWTFSVNAKNLTDETYLLPLGGAYSPAAGLFGRLANWQRQVTFNIRHDF